MASVANDYARAVAFLARSALPAYVSFIERSSARGIEDDRESPQRIYVRTRDGVIVNGDPESVPDAAAVKGGGSSNPFGKHLLFDPACYTPSGENGTRWNGQPALRVRLHDTCDDLGFTELYVDPQTFRPMAADGVIPTEDAPMGVSVELRYVTIGAHTVPSQLRAHAVGHGWLFWARERAEVDYEAYRFDDRPPTMLRQAS